MTQEQDGQAAELIETQFVVQAQLGGKGPWIDWQFCQSANEAQRDRAGRCRACPKDGWRIVMRRTTDEVVEAALSASPAKEGE